MPPPALPLQLALQSGNASALSGEENLTLLERARSIAMADKAAQPAVAAIVPDQGQAWRASANGSFGNSVGLAISDPRTTVPLAITGAGDIVVAAAQIGLGRAISYGANMDQAVGGDTTHPAYPFMKATTAWLLTGNKHTFPKAVRYAVGGKAYKSDAIPAMMRSAGATVSKVECDILVENDCWQDAELMIVYQNSSSDATAAAQVSKYLAAGKPLLYMNENRGGFNSAVNAVLSIRNAGSLYWSGNLTVPAQTAAEVAAQVGAASDERIRITRLLADDSLQKPEDWNALLGSINKIASEYKGTQSAGQNLFGQDARYDYHKHLVLWADLYRRDHAVYDNSVGPNKGTPARFLRQMAADTWTHAVRDSALAPADMGDWMSGRSKDLPVATTPETITVTIPNQGSGATLIGRLAIPGKPVTVEVVDDDGVAGLGLKIGHIRRYPTPMSDGVPGENRYTSPYQPGGNDTPLDKTKANTRTYAMGGPLFLNYSGNPQGNRIVTLKITGTAKYGHWDYTQPMSDAEKQAAVAAIQDGAGSWQTAKMVGGELQQASIRIGNVSSTEAVDSWVYQIQKWVFEFNHRVHGYHNIPLTAKQTELCTAFGWDCASRSKHGAPGVQHFVGWWAQCGYACSGNPSDISGKTDSGWGTLHELGHNTVTGMESMYTCGTECNNNIVAGISSIGKYWDSQGRVDANGDRVRHDLLYQAVRAARDTGKSGDALIDEAYDQLWNKAHNRAKKAVTIQIAFVYGRERLGLAQPTAESVMEFMGLVNKGWRLKGNSWDAADPDKYAMGGYAAPKDVTNENGFYVLSSKIIGKDLRKVFQMYGFKLDPRALASVARLNLPLADAQLYALHENGANRLHEGRWLNMEGQTPAYPGWTCASGSCTISPP